MTIDNILNEAYRKTGFEFENFMHKAYGGILVKEKSEIKIGRKFLQTILTESMSKFAEDNNYILKAIQVENVNVMPFKADIADVSISSKVKEKFTLEGKTITIDNEINLPSGKVDIECKWDASLQNKKDKNRVYTTMWLEAGKVATREAESSIKNKATKYGITDTQLEILKKQVNYEMQQLKTKLNEKYGIDKKEDWEKKYDKKLISKAENLYLAKGTGSLEDSKSVSIIFKRLLDLGFQFKFGKWHEFGRVRADVNDIKASVVTEGKVEKKLGDKGIKISGWFDIESNIIPLIMQNIGFVEKKSNVVKMPVSKKELPKESQEKLVLAASVENYLGDLLREFKHV